jgi:hypothetical protein
LRRYNMGDPGKIRMLRHPTFNVVRPESVGPYDKVRQTT